MKVTLKVFMLLLFTSGLILTSCRKEEMEFEQAADEDTLEANSNVASLMQRTAMNDGSKDNIIDKSNCFHIKFPVTVEINNGMEVVVNSEAELETIEAVFDQYDEDNDLLNITYPITIILSDFSEAVVNDLAELNSYTSTCNGENEIDTDIECIDFIYPITTSLFNPDNEIINTIVLTNDNQLYNFITNLTDADIVVINFPVSVILSDASEILISNLADLESSITNAINDCDEDDDYNYNDDDCNDCTVEQLAQLLTGCSNWTVNNLDRNSSNEDYYVGYKFNFMADGTLNAANVVWSYDGTWVASGTGNNITVTIDIPSLPDCNNNWVLHEIKIGVDEMEFDLNLGDDKLRYESSCESNAVNDTALTATLTAGSWEITQYFNDTDQTVIFNNYVFNFFNGGLMTITNGFNTNYGYWNTSYGDEEVLELNLNFGNTALVLELTEDWDVIELSSNLIRLRDISTEDGTEDLLTLERI